MSCRNICYRHARVAIHNTFRVASELIPDGIASHPNPNPSPSVSIVQVFQPDIDTVSNPHIQSVADVKSSDPTFKSSDHT